MSEPQTFTDPNPQAAYLDELRQEAAGLSGTEREVQEAMIAELAGEMALAESIQAQADADIAAAKAMALGGKREASTEPTDVQRQTVDFYSYLVAPAYGITAVNPGRSMNITKESMPWLSDEKTLLETVSLTADDGTEFEFGSVVHGSSSLEKIAKKVPKQEVEKVERALFKALPSWLQGKAVANIDSGSAYAPLGADAIYKVGKIGKDAARLAFVRRETDDGKPLIIEVGVARHKDQNTMLARMTPNKSGQKDKRS